jgi:hypothetical protein
LKCWLARSLPICRPSVTPRRRAALRR